MSVTRESKNDKKEERERCREGGGANPPYATYILLLYSANVISMETKHYTKHKKHKQRKYAKCAEKT